jgi:hypothetical protein
LYCTTRVHTEQQTHKKKFIYQIDVDRIVFVVVVVLVLEIIVLIVIVIRCFGDGVFATPRLDKNRKQGKKSKLNTQNEDRKKRSKTNAPTLRRRRRCRHAW